MKAIHVINGLLKKYTLEEVNIITPKYVIFSGSYSQWKETSIDMVLFKNKIKDCEVIDRMIFNNRKAFIFYYVCLFYGRRSE